LEAEEADKIQGY